MPLDGNPPREPLREARERGHNCASPGWDRSWDCVAETYEAELAKITIERDHWLALCEMVSTYYSGSLDHRPSYVAIIRRALENAPSAIPEPDADR